MSFLEAAMRRLGLVAIFAAAIACKQSAPLSVADPAFRGLRIQLPPACKLETHPSSQATVTCDNQAIVFLEPNTEEMVQAGDLTSHLERQGASHLGIIDQDRFVAVSYRLGTSEANRHFLAVKNVESRRVWCSSLTALSSADLEMALSLCRSIASEA